jgi:hypothetical protein
MSTTGDIISITSRLRRAPPTLPLQEAAAPRERGIAGLLIVLLVVAGVGGVGLLWQTHDGREVAHLQSEHRGAIFARAAADLVETCRLPEALEGPVREHCVNEASFVLLFPECDANCGRLARDLLPHARR